MRSYFNAHFKVTRLGKWQERPQRQSPYEELSPINREVFSSSKGNVVRIQSRLGA